MQRLFSTFPASWPGLGLLLLRGSMAFTIVSIAWDRLMAIQSFGQDVRQPLALAIAGCLLVGVATPIAAGAQVVVSLWALYDGSGSERVSWFLVGVGTSLMMVGPGAWSVDARRFGRRRIDIGRR